jgi:diguanylate cyclase (GGDEF)-like protein
MRGIRLGGVLLGSVLCVSAAVGVVGGSRDAASQLEQSLTARTLETASAIEEYFARARAIDLLIANTPSFKERFEPPGTARLASEKRDILEGRAARLHRHTSEKDRHIQDVLAYLEKIYPGRIGEACVINRQGIEVARVVRGKAAAYDDLSHEEAENDFFRPAFALPPGRVFQSKPYVSPDTGEWVISNSTQITTGAAKSPAIAHFEITMDSFRTQAERAQSDIAVMIVDRDTGRILSETGRPQEDGARLGRPATALTRNAAATGTSAGLMTLDGTRAAYQEVPTIRGNQNDWLVVASAADTGAPWSNGPGKGAIAAAIAALVLLVSSILGIRANQRELRRRATTDALTGLANRAVLHSRLGAALDHQQTDRTSALLLLDLDGFKEVNDTLGHHHGDVLLAEVAQRIRGQMRGADLAARLGGDEFAILVADMPEGVSGIESVVSRVLGVIRRPFRLDGVGVHVDASVGVAVVHEHGDTPELLIQRADVAMYQAKNSGAGFVVYDPSTDPHSARRLGLTAGLLEAIERRQITLHYQPKVDVRTGSVVGVEALIRWTHPTMGPLPPDEFIPVAEKTGLIRLLTEAVVDESLAQCRVWLDQGRDVPIAVNCSAVDLVDERLVDQIARALDAHRVPASMLLLEITESSILVDPDRASQVLDRLHAMGVGLAIDDYGTGYTSLTYLKQLPVSELKIDREFVSGVTLGGADAMIVRSTIELGHSLGMRVVAEGVEDEYVLDYLRAVGCDIAQGYHVTRPLPAPALTDWFDSRDAVLG